MKQLLLLSLSFVTSASWVLPAQVANATPVAVLAQLIPANAAPSGVKVSQAGNVRAELYYQKDPTDSSPFDYQEVRLKLYRQGQLYLEEQPTLIRGGSGSYVAAPVGMQVQDLDGDKEPEVRLDYYTGGAHCCTNTVIYRYDAQKNKYYSIRHAWGNSGYRLQELDQDGLPEFVSQDDAFAYAFASYAASGRPVQIWQYRQGKMIDITRRYPKLIYADAYRYWQTYLEAKKEGYETKGVLAAYLADKYLLGQERDGWQRVQQVYRNKDRQQFFTDLRQFLQKYDYASVRAK